MTRYKLVGWNTDKFLDYFIKAWENNYIFEFPIAVNEVLESNCGTLAKVNLLRKHKLKSSKVKYVQKTTLNLPLEYFTYETI